MHKKKHLKKRKHVGEIVQGTMTDFSSSIVQKGSEIMEEPWSYNLKQ